MATNAPLSHVRRVSVSPMEWRPRLTAGIQRRSASRRAARPPNARKQPRAGFPRALLRHRRRCLRRRATLAILEALGCWSLPPRRTHDGTTRPSMLLRRKRRRRCCLRFVDGYLPSAFDVALPIRAGLQPAAAAMAMETRIAPPTVRSHPRCSTAVRPISNRLASHPYVLPSANKGPHFWDDGKHSIQWYVNLYRRAREA